MRWHVLIVGLWLVGCSDDGGPRTDGGTDGKVLPDLGVVEGGSDISAPDQGLAPPCELATLGKACTQGGGECGAVNTCLVTQGSAGFCSCACIPDRTETEVMDEDSCPGSGFACGLDSASKPRCLALLANTPQLPNCATGTAIVADPTDTAFMVAARIVPTSYPFTLTGIRYALQGPGSKTPECDTGLAHRAEVHVNDLDKPSPTPTVLGSFSSPATTSTKESRQVVQALSAPVQVNTGEVIYVLVEVVRDGSKSLCADACADNSATGAKSFIDVDSNQPPYVWESFESKQWDGDLSFAALGF